MFSNFFVRLIPMICAMLLTCNSVYAQCGPQCPPNCDCGCATGARCVCDDPVKPQKVNPPASCCYECPVGEGCTCSDVAPAPEIKRGGSPKCPPNCDCGCANGKPCQCNAPAFVPKTAAADYSDNYDNRGQYAYGVTGQEEIEVFIPLSAAYEDFSGECGYRECGVWGQWFPDNPVLFREFMADPRALIFSAAWRFNDEALFKNTIPVSYYDTCVFYRWNNVWPWDGMLQIELQGALWADFNPLGDSSPLLNADYYVGVPLTYAVGPWAFRLRGYHISCHIGDEFLLQHPWFKRRNPSAEYLDFFVSWDFTPEIRFYGGVGWVPAMDESFVQSKWYAACGTELRLLRFGFVDECQRIYGAPIFGVHFRDCGDFGSRIDQTYILGYEIGKLTGEYKKLRLFFEYHDGYSVEGQFARLKTDYFAIKLTYGY